jgi:hypothetical protein
MTDHLSREGLINKASDLKVIPTLNSTVEKVLHILGNHSCPKQALRGSPDQVEFIRQKTNKT